MSTLASEVAAQNWYHSIELPGGIVTPGRFDTRKALRKVPFPETLAGKRCLDVGTADGFWAFEMERRGAAEVVAIDLLDPSQRDVTINAALRTPLREGESSRRTVAFDLAHRALDSSVLFRNLSVYDLSPETVGEFDFVFMGSLLIHLRDPVLALNSVRSVTKGELLSYDAISPALTLFHPRTPTARLRGVSKAEWWLPNVSGMRRMIAAAGFRVLRAGGISFIPRQRKGLTLGGSLRHPLTNSMLYLWGVPQTWVLARRRPNR